MVVDMPSPKSVDDLFQALGDPTRRDILERASRGGVSVSRLASAYPMSFAAVQKHVTVLERAGLIWKERRGRERLVHIEPSAIRQARLFLDQLEMAWRGRVERMDVVLARSMEKKGRKG